MCVWMCKIVNKMEGSEWVAFDLLIDVNDYGVGGDPKELYYYPKVDQIFQELSIQSNTLFPAPKR